MVDARRHAAHCTRPGADTVGTWIEIVRCTGCGAVTSTTRRGREDMIEDLVAENTALTTKVTRVAALADRLDKMVTYSIALDVVHVLRHILAVK